MYFIIFFIVVPAEFQIDPYTKTLGDPSRRPEIQNATIEYIASQDYMVNILDNTAYSNLFYYLLYTF